MKDIYTKKLSSEETNKSIVAEPAVDAYIARKPQGFVSKSDIRTNVSDPSRWTAEELEDIIQMSEVQYTRGIVHSNEEVMSYLKNLAYVN